MSLQITSGNSNNQFYNGGDAVIGTLSPVNNGNDAVDRGSRQFKFNDNYCYNFQNIVYGTYSPTSAQTKPGHFTISNNTFDSCGINTGWDSIFHSTKFDSILISDNHYVGGTTWDAPEHNVLNQYSGKQNANAWLNKVKADTLTAATVITPGGSSYVTETNGGFTPIITIGGSSPGITYTNQTGVYKQIGNRVDVWITVQLSSKGGLTGDIRFYGLPFTSSNNVVLSVGTLLAQGSTATGTYYPYLNPNHNNFFLIKQDGTALLTASDVPDNITFNIQLSYSIN